jgi:hypothetical protein
MWSLAFAADLDAESAETLTLQVVADRAEPAVVTVHESGHYLLRGRLLAGGGDPVPIELSCTRRKEGEPATGEGRDGCLEIGRIGLI